MRQPFIFPGTILVDTMHDTMHVHTQSPVLGNGYMCVFKQEEIHGEHV